MHMSLLWFCSAFVTIVLKFAVYNQCTHYNDGFERLLIKGQSKVNELNIYSIVSKVGGFCSSPKLFQPNQMFP